MKDCLLLAAALAACAAALVAGAAPDTAVLPLLAVLALALWGKERRP